jgi:hypothetical protein
MLTTTLLPNGKVAIYDGDQLLGRARDQAHADDWCRRWTEQGCDLPALAWRLGKRLWAVSTPEERRRLSQPVREAA